MSAEVDLVHCPLCGKGVHATHRLRTHLVGSGANGGHEVTLEEATFAAAAATIATTPGDADQFLDRRFGTW
jgi:hypothetical protein